MLDINETTLVQVTNNSDRTLKYAYASRPYVIKPGQTVGVPYYAAALWFGRPDAVNTGDAQERHLKYRTHEIERLSTFYGVYGDPWTTDFPFTAEDDSGKKTLLKEYVLREDGQYWHPQLPNVTVKSLEGEELPVVVMDPEGDVVTPVEASTISEAKSTREALEALQQQMRALQLKLARDTSGVNINPAFETEGGVDAPLVVPEAPEPLPTSDVPRGPGRPRKAR